MSAGARGVRAVGPRAWWPVALAAAIALGCAGVLGADRAGLDRPIGFAAGVLAALLAVLALPSVPTRLASIAILTLGGLVAVRHAAMPGADATVVLGWAVATTLALVTLEHVQRDGTRPLGDGPSGWAAVLPVFGAVVGIVVVLAVPLAPVVQGILAQHVRLGEAPGITDLLESERSVRTMDRIDMSRRPRLSDRVVMTVDAPAPAFWRGATFDEWDGVAWTRSAPQAAPLVPDATGAVTVAAEAGDPAPRAGREFVQRFSVEARYTDMVFAAPSPVRIEIAQRTAQWRDGTVGARDPLGRGATYTVTSRIPEATEASLRASAELAVPQEVRARYAAPPRVTPRVAAAASEVAGDAATPYDAVRALEAWMGERTRYSLDAPLPPRGVDVVDHFLFDARLGWCEQVASSLVVMLRTLGVPARLAVGFVPGDLHALSGRFVVRERHAHAWAEVYFPGVGWQGFDPTASVPLAGEAPTVRTPLDRVQAAAPLVLAAGAGVGTVVIGLRTGRGGRRRRGSRTWAGRQLAALERVGRSVDRPRAPGETPRAYGRRLTRALGDAGPAEVGDAIDIDTFSPDGLEAQQRTAAEAALAGIVAPPGRRGRVLR